MFKTKTTTGQYFDLIRARVVILKILSVKMRKNLILESIGPLWRRKISTIVALFDLLTSKSPP